MCLDYGRGWIDVGLACAKFLASQDTLQDCISDVIHLVPLIYDNNLLSPSLVVWILIQNVVYFSTLQREEFLAEALLPTGKAPPNGNGDARPVDDGGFMGDGGGYGSDGGYSSDGGGGGGGYGDHGDSSDRDGDEYTYNDAARDGCGQGGDGADVAPIALEDAFRDKPQTYQDLCRSHIVSVINHRLGSSGVPQVTLSYLTTAWKFYTQDGGHSDLKEVTLYENSAVKTGQIDWTRPHKSYVFSTVDKREGY